MNQRGSVKMWILAWLAASGLALGGLIGIGCAISANACPFGDDAIESTTGEGIWVEAACIACHGADGGGSDANPKAPSLITPPSSELTLAELISQINDGSVGLMPRFEGKLTEQQIDAVARYVLELRGEGDA